MPPTYSGLILGLSCQLIKERVFLRKRKTGAALDLKEEAQGQELVYMKIFWLSQGLWNQKASFSAGGAGGQIQGLMHSGCVLCCRALSLH